MRICLFSLLLVLMSGISLDALATRDTVSVYFEFNQSNLEDEARDSLDAAIYTGDLSDSHTLQIIGYTDVIGSEQYNLDLSRSRANAVRDYLINSGFRPERITLILGKGKMNARKEAGPDGTPSDRRVDIVRTDHSNPSVIEPTKKPVDKVHFKPNVPNKLSTTDIATVAIGETLVLDNIYFVAGRHVTRPESDDALEDLYTTLLKHPDIRINIEGHVCCISANATDAMDDDTHMVELSVNRARYIRDYLVSKGLNPDRLEYVGYGHQRPIVSPETNEEDANRNRRVEIRIIQ